MITRIQGTIMELGDNSVSLSCGGICYEVFVPANVLKNLASRAPDDSVELVTYHYYQTDPSRSIPVLIGFLNKIEREFFEKFITVSGIGPKAAVKALTVPISQIADAIDAGDRIFLKTLPGVGEQRAREIIAKLQGKVARFGLIREAGGKRADAAGILDFKSEGLEVLLQLQYRREEAQQMIDRALSNNKNIRSAEELLNEVYRQKSTVEAVK
jgi:Holliday junction DNA helicase RuvA